MKRLINIIMGVAAVTFVATMFTSCMESKEAHRLFADVEAVIEDHPDSALALLDSAYEASQDYPKSQRMRYNLLLTEAKNKAYVPIEVLRGSINFVGEIEVE